MSDEKIVGQVEAHIRDHHPADNGLSRPYL